MIVIIKCIVFSNLPLVNAWQSLFEETLIHRLMELLVDSSCKVWLMDMHYRFAMIHVAWWCRRLDVWTFASRAASYRLCICVVCMFDWTWQSNWWFRHGIRSSSYFCQNAFARKMHSVEIDGNTKKGTRLETIRFLSFLPNRIPTAPGWHAMGA